MNEDEQRAWRNEVLDLVFEALATSSSLRSILVFKGARVLNRRLGTAPRQSFDIDANLALEFVQRHPSRTDQQQFIKTELTRIISRYFEHQAVVRFKLKKVAVTPRPKRDHHLGWNAFLVEIGLVDRSRAHQGGIPKLDIDIAAPETLGPNATAPLLVGDNEATGYTLQRIAGEKLRAFLSSLPTYRKKVTKAGDAVRAKDIYDLARIVAVRPVGNNAFWSSAFTEFRLACESRYVDCDGMVTFEEQLDVTEASYSTDTTLPKDIPFAEAWIALRSVVELFEQLGWVPMRFPKPPEDSRSTNEPLVDTPR